MVTDSPTLRTSWRPEHPERPHPETEYLVKEERSVFSITFLPLGTGAPWEAPLLKGWPPEIDLLNALQG